MSLEEPNDETAGGSEHGEPKRESATRRARTLRAVQALLNPLNANKRTEVQRAKDREALNQEYLAAIDIIRIVGRAFESNRIIAAFTVVMGVVAILQFLTLLEQMELLRRQTTYLSDQTADFEAQTSEMVKQSTTATQQWEAMKIQNSEIIKQGELAKGQLDQAARAIAQTDKVLELMRLDQRPWLSVLQPTMPKLVDIKPGDRIEVSIPVKNTGKTPGTVHWIKFRTNTWPHSDSIDEILREFHDDPRREERQTVVAPDVTLTMHVKKSPLLTKAMIDSVKEPDGLVIYVMGTFEYSVTGDDKVFSTEFLFRFDPVADSLYAHEKHNHMK